jgi:hypothetical protein
MRYLFVAALALLLPACLPPAAGDAVLTTEVDAAGKPLNQASVFTLDTPRILCAVKVAGMPATAKVRVQWLYLNQNNWQVLHDESFSAGNSSYIAFALKSPLTGWPQGEYSVKLYVDGRDASRLNFAIRPVDSVTLPAINNFSITPGTIVSGQPATLSWNVSGATRVVIEPGDGSASLSAGGSRLVNPAADTTYRITALNSGGPASASVSIKVLPPQSGRPDLVLTDIFREIVMVYYTVKNQGTAASTGCNAQLFVGPTLLGTDYIAPLGPGEQRTEVFGQYSWGYPLNTTATVCVDTDGQNTEGNEENNCMTRMLAGMRTL